MPIKERYVVLVDGKKYVLRALNLSVIEGVPCVHLDLRTATDNSQISGTIKLDDLIQKGLEDETLIKFQF